MEEVTSEVMMTVVMMKMVSMVMGIKLSEKVISLLHMSHCSYPDQDRMIKMEIF